MMTIEDDLVSVDNLIEDYLLEEPRNEFIQSCDIVAFNKICKNSSFCILVATLKHSCLCLYWWLYASECMFCFLQKLVWSCSIKHVRDAGLSFVSNRREFGFPVLSIFCLVLLKWIQNLFYGFIIVIHGNVFCACRCGGKIVVSICKCWVLTMCSLESIIWWVLES